MATPRQTATPYRAFGESLVLQEATAALEETQKRGPATEVVFNPATGRLELVRHTAGYRVRN
jgi:hypothetical protein